MILAALSLYMKTLNNYIIILTLLISSNFGTYAQVCIPTYGTVCFSGGGGITYDVIDSFWTVGGITDISNLDTDCSMLPSNYTYTGMAVTACPGETIETNVQCQPAAYDQGFAIWIDWNQDDAFAVAEKVYASPGSGDEVWTGSFTVPVDAVPGTYNMRVRSKFASAGAGINPCDMQTYGETEDYLVIVGTCNPTICEGDTVTIDLGTMPPGPITYAWLPAVDISDPFGGPTVDVWPSDTTTYTCTITSVDSTWSVPIDVYVVHPANPFAGLDDTICHSLALGYHLLGEVETDEATLFFDWDKILGPGGAVFLPDDNMLDPTVSVLTAGFYEFVMKTEDLSGHCPAQRDTVAILYSKALHTLAKTEPLCFGSSDGTITVTGTGTLPSVEYSIDGITWQVSNVFTDLPAGTYTVYSRDSFGCEFNNTITLVDPVEVVLTVSSDTLICRNGTATVSASATGGATYTYDWSIPGADAGPVQTISPVATPTIVTVTAYNENGCPSEEGSIEITLRDPITLTISANDSICPGFGSGAAVVAIGGDGAYEYSWTANGSAMAETGSTISTSPASNTTYCVTVNDGCETTPVTICTQTIINPLPAPSFTSDITAGCNPSTVNFETIISPTDIAVWTINGATFTDVSTVSYEFTEVGFYDVTLEITNQFGCVNEITAVDYMEIVDVPYPDFFINPNPTTIFNTEVRLSPSLTGAGYNYEWSMPGGTPATSTDESPTVIYPEGIPEDYLVTLTVTNDLGCAGSIEHYVNILTDVIIYAPNIFTPDGDQFNEGWRVYIDGIDIYDYHCLVFNRWGEIIWESFDATGMWMGTYGSGTAQDGTYVWVVTAKENTSDKKIEFRGTVTIAR